MQYYCTRWEASVNMISLPDGLWQFQTLNRWAQLCEDKMHTCTPFTQLQISFGYLACPQAICLVWTAARACKRNWSKRSREPVGRLWDIIPGFQHSSVMFHFSNKTKPHAHPSHFTPTMEIFLGYYFWLPALECCVSLFKQVPHSLRTTGHHCRWAPLLPGCPHSMQSKLQGWQHHLWIPCPSAAGVETGTR